MKSTSSVLPQNIFVAATPSLDSHIPPCGLTVPLLEWAVMSWIDGVLGLTGDQWIKVGVLGSGLAWVIVLVVWYMLTRPKAKTK